jgi:hypothetical protein
MEQREITDSNNTRWTCVEAFGGMNEKLAEKAKEITESENGKVTVVCTPSGGAQTVRLQLAEDWQESMADEDLKRLIEESSGEQQTT